MKTVRIENADTVGDHLVVEIWEVQPQGGDDHQLKETLLMHPTEMLNLSLNHCKYAIVRAGSGPGLKERRHPAPRY